MAISAGMNWLPSPGPQTDAYFSKADLLLYGGQAGGGKGLRPDAPVLTPFGWRAIGALKVGDAICATDGTVTKVIGVYHRGVQPLYRLTFSDGSTVDCDADHQWKAWVASRHRKIGNELVGGEAGVRKWVTSAIADHYAAGKERLYLPIMSAPAAFNVAGSLKGKGHFQKRAIPPYVLGVLLGDGCLRKDGVIFTTADPEIAERVASELGCDLSEYRYEGKTPAYRIPTAAIRARLEDVGLIGCGSESKFVPRIYLFGSAEERFALLQGLMDTDGWSEEDGNAFYCTVSPRLRDDVRHLARSLGAVVTVRERIPTFTHNGEKKDGQLAYSLRIKMPDAERVFHLERKRARVRGKVFQSMGLALNSIERIASGETVCIAVEHPNSLFVTDNFVVTHNSDLGLGLAFTAHRQSLIMRRRYTDLSGLTDRAIIINGSRDGFNGSAPPRLSTKDGRVLDFGAAANPGDEQAWLGRPRDLLYVDEASQFLGMQIRLLMAHIRTTIEGQRTRAVLGTNPPIDAAGDYLVEMFRPWLDLTYPRPARPGELRWFITPPDGKDVEVDGPEMVQRDGADFLPKSRTFIPAALSDNPYLAKTNYRAELDNLPEPYRSALRDGNFMAARSDADWQVIPTQWIIAAQQRWTADGWRGAPMTAMGLDIGAGRDETVLAWRHGPWFAPVDAMSGDAAKDPAHAAQMVIPRRKDNCPIVVDVGGGFGGAAMVMFDQNGFSYREFNGAARTSAKAREGNLPFINKRAEAWWKFREALDPNQQGGSVVALPPDPQLRADLAAPTWKQALSGIQVESKEDIKKRLGRSPDRGDAVVMCLSEGEAAVATAIAMRNPPRVIRANEAVKKRWR